MLPSLMSLLPLALGSDGGAHHSRRGRPRRGRPIREDLGKWIWSQGFETAANFYLRARKDFKLESKPSKALVRACADSGYKLFVNGRYVGKGPARSGAGYVYYDIFDITDLLDSGQNVIACVACYIDERDDGCVPRKPGLICRAEIDTNAGTQVIATDETWKVQRAVEWTNLGSRLNESLGFQEVYDAGAAPGNWTEVKFNDKGWENAVAVGLPGSMPWGELISSEILPPREERISPAAVVGLFNSPPVSAETRPAEMPDVMAGSVLLPLKAGSVKDAEALTSEHGLTHVRTPRGDQGVAVILDFGREVFGNVEVCIAGSGAGIIDLGYGELLEDGHVKPNRGGIRYTDRLILKKGPLDWQSFEPRAFRYMQIEFRRCSKPVAIESISVNQTTYTAQQTGSFECNDSLINDIWRVGAYTAQLCMQDTFIDSPARGRDQSWADARILSRVAYYAFGDTKLLARGLRLLAEDQCRDGSISGVYPPEDPPISDFALFWVFSILDHYAFSDDVSVLRDLYPSLGMLLDCLARFTDEDGLLFEVPGRLFIDFADLDKRGNSTALNCLYHQALRVASVVASVLGKEDDAERYWETAAKLRIAVNKYLYSPQRGLYAECRVQGKLVERFSRQTNIFAALFDIPDHYQKSTILRGLLECPLPDLDTPYFATHFLEALYSGDRHADALGIIRKRWGDMIKNGATTFWEHFSADGSLCRGWSCGPTRDLIAEYVGIKPALASDHFSVTPHTAGLDWARGSIATPRGPLAVEWRAARNSLAIRIDVPRGLTVDVYPPGPPESKVTVNGKPHPTRVVTLGGGGHAIKVSVPRPARPTKMDEGLPPEPIRHVEVIDNAPIRGRRPPLASGRPRRARPNRFEVREPAARVVEIESPGEAPPVEQVVEPVGTDLQVGTPGGITMPPGEIMPARKPSRRSRRGGRRHSKSAPRETAQQSEPSSELSQPSQEASKPVEPSSPPPGEPSAETSASPKRRRRYYPRRPRKAQENKPREEGG